MKERIILLATAWGPIRGGINALNFDLAESMARLYPEKYEIVCIVATATDADRADAKAKRVRLQSLAQPTLPDRLDEANVEVVLAVINSDGTGPVRWVIGHDVVTGAAAVKVAAAVGARSVIIHHMSYRAYAAFKRTAGSEILSRDRFQTELIQAADVALGVGPRLAKRVTALRRRGHNTQLDFVDHLLIPGLSPAQNLDRSPEFSALTFGRVSGRDDRIKLASLAVAGFAKAIADTPELFGNDPTMTVLGLSDEELEQEALAHLAEKVSGRSLNVIGVDYIENRTLVLAEVARQNVCLMLSMHEGFGLAGWEAIAAATPLVVSENTGLYDLLDFLLAGAGTGCVYGIRVRGAAGDQAYREQDVADVAMALREIAHNPGRAARNAETLRELLIVKGRCTWEQTAIHLARQLGLDYSPPMASLSIADAQPTMLLSLAESATVVAEIVSRRNQHFAELWSALSTVPQDITNVVLFGGISSTLLKPDALRLYQSWLIQNPSARLFLCYETGEGAGTRARLLDRSGLGSSDALPSDPHARMLAKVAQVDAAREELARELGQLDPGAMARFLSLPIRHALTFYCILADQDIYFTPIAEKRSSTSVSMKLNKEASPFRRQVLESLQYNVRMVAESEGGAVSSALLEHLDSLLNKM